MKASEKWKNISPSPTVAKQVRQLKLFGPVFTRFIMCMYFYFYSFCIKTPNHEHFYCVHFFPAPHCTIFLLTVIFHFFCRHGFLFSQQINQISHLSWQRPIFGFRYCHSIFILILQPLRHVILAQPWMPSFFSMAGGGGGNASSLCYSTFHKILQWQSWYSKWQRWAKPIKPISQFWAFIPLV